jgi:quercetin dioxygenase-like cupin family protein
VVRGSIELAKQRIEYTLDVEGIVASSMLHRWTDIEPEQLNRLIGRQYVVGTKTMLARMVLKKGAEVPVHHHFHEQMSHVVEGALKFIVDGEEVVVRAGEILCLPPNVPHGVVALEDSVALDIFNPQRQDWIDGDDAYLRGGAGTQAPKRN